MNSSQASIAFGRPSLLIIGDKLRTVSNLVLAVIRMQC